MTADDAMAAAVAEALAAAPPLTDDQVDRLVYLLRDR